jgi:hypothetical protein
VFLGANPWGTGAPVNLCWTDESASVVQPGGGFNVKIATDAAFTQNVSANVVPGSASNGYGSVVALPFAPISGVATYFYEVQAFTPNGTSAWTVGSGPIQAALTTTAINATSPIVYGDTAVVTVTVTSPQGVPTGNVALSVDGGAAILQGLPGIAPNSIIFNLSGLTVGTHNLVATYPDVANPLITTSTAGGSIVVNPAALSVTASSATINFGDPVPAITASYSGFVNGDSAGSLTTAPTCSTTYTQGSPVSGSPYPTTCSGAVDPNYTITYTPGTVNVNGIPLTITASSASVVFGSAIPSVTPSFTGFVNGDTSAVLTTQPICMTTATSTSPVGTYPTTCSGAATTNYNISYVPGTVTITAASLIITASSATVTYGSAVPAVTPSFAGFVNGDTSAILTAQPVCSTSATATSNVGTYPSNCSSAAATNYTISYVPGTITIGASPLTITASNGAMTYGGVVPAITPSFAGFVNGQNSSVLTAQPVCSTTATATSNVGTYASSCSGAAAANYVIGYAPGTVTVSQATSRTTITTHAPSPSNVGQAVVVSASVAPQFTGLPTGTITISASTGESCVGALSAGVASCSITFATAGTRTLAATYGGDLNFAGSVSTGVAQSVVALGVTVNPTSLTFADTLLNTNSATMSVTLTNNGARLTTLSYSFTDPNYTKVTGTNNCGTTLNTNASCVIYVRFRPSTLGAHAAILNINAGTTLASVALSGNGVAPIAVLGTLTPSPLLATRGSTAQGTVSLNNTGTGPLTIASITIGGTNATQFSQTNDCGTSLAAGGNCTITVTFHPPTNTARGNKSAVLRVRDNSNGVANSLQTSALNGTAQ